MSLADLPQVHVIETLCYTTPWSLNSFKYEIGNPDTILKSAVSENQIIGYVCARTILDMTHLLNITVLPEHRCQGVAGILLRAVIEELKRSKPGIKLTLEVRQSNIAAIKLYEKFGFTITGTRKGYYQKPADDALLMELEIH